MFYTKKLTTKMCHEIPKYDTSANLRYLNYFPFINRRNAKQIKETLNDDEWIRVLCDISSASITQLFYRGIINRKKVWTSVSGFFHQAIQMRGFDPVIEPELQFNSDNAKGVQVEILVAGTPEKQIYQSRVDGCLSILREAKPNKCRIIFSGANPHASMQSMGIESGVRTYNEAFEMELYFRKKITIDPLPPSVQWDSGREKESSNTSENIENFFSGVNFPKKQRAHVYVVSSLYHLPRFVDLVISKIKEGNLPVSELTFVCPEDTILDKPIGAVNTHMYFKSCMYEFYYQLYKDTPPEDIMKPAHVQL